MDGNKQCTLRLCVGVRKKVQFYYWKNNTFLDYREELSLADVPKTISWCQNSICVGFKRDYYLVEVSDIALVFC